MNPLPPEAPSSPGRLESFCGRRSIVLFLCLVGAFAAYAPVLGGGLVWDDTYLVGENPFFRSPVFGLEVFRHWLFFDSFSTYYRPVQNWSYMLDYWLWRGNTAGYHLTNILLHAGAGFLLCRLLGHLLPSLLARGAKAPVLGPSVLALGISLIWIVHPIHNAAVAYISGRADSLAAVFALLAWLLVLRAEAAAGLVRRLAWIGTAVVAILSGLCSKEIALMWVVLFVVHRWLVGRGLRQKLIATGAVLAVLGIYALLHSLPAYRAPMEDGPPAPLAGRVLLMLRALGDYTGLIFYPANLYMERSLSDPAAYKSVALWRTHARGEWLSIIGLLALLAAGRACFWRASGRSLRIAGAAWFGIAFLPISNLFPLNAEVAEHWIYLASIGAFILLAGVICAWPERCQRWAGVAVVLALVTFTIRTAVRSSDWVDAETFCRRTIESGGASPRILMTLANVHGQRGDWAMQEQVLRKTLQRFPDFTPARLQLGICLARQGHAPEAEKLLDIGSDAAGQAARRFPRTSGAALNLAKIRSDAGDQPGAIAILDEAQSRFPDSWDIVRYAGELKKDPAAVESYAAAHWWHLESWLAVANARLTAGQFDRALAAFEQASRLDLYDGRPLAGVARAELSLSHPDAALAAQLAAIERSPDSPGHYLELSALLEKLGRPTEAAAALHKAQLLAASAGKS
jgi:hypothetical protein